jgi:bifunctional non-homologous end joining protein LigD
MIQPMLCEEVDESHLPKYYTTNYVAERKLNGVRVIIDTTNGVKIYGRNGTDYSERLIEIKTDAEKLPKGIILDGEIVAYKPDGTEWLVGAQKRCSTAKISRQHQLMKEIPVIYEAYDILFSGASTMGETYSIRKERLLDIITFSLTMTSSIRYVPFYDDIESTWKLAKEHEWEGIIIKNRDSGYYEGSRSFDWIKVKVWKTKTFTVKGYLESDKRGIKSLALFDGEAYMGRCGQGMDDADINNLLKLMQKIDVINTDLDTEPIIMVQPFPVTIKYYGLADNGALRNAILLGIGVFISDEA